MRRIEPLFPLVGGAGLRWTTGAYCRASCTSSATGPCGVDHASRLMARTRRPTTGLSAGAVWAEQPKLPSVRSTGGKAVEGVPRRIGRDLWRPELQRPRRLQRERASPRGLLLTKGQVSDYKGAAMLPAVLDAPVPIADRGYDADWFRQALRDRGMRPCVRGCSGRSHPIRHGKQLYRSARATKSRSYSAD